MPFSESADMGPNRRRMDRGGDSNLICISEHRRMLRWICERYAHPAPYAIICIHVAMRFHSLGLTPRERGLSIRSSPHTSARLSLVVIVLGSGFVAADASDSLSRPPAVIDAFRTKPH